MESGLYGVRHDGRIVRHLATITPLRRFVRVVSRLRASLVRAAGCVAPYRAGRYIGRVVISRLTGTLSIPNVFLRGTFRRGFKVRNFADGPCLP